MTAPSRKKPVIIHWGISSFFGWGIYGLNLALNWSNDPELEPASSYPLQKHQIFVDPLRQRALAGFSQNSADLLRKLQDNAGKTVSINAPVLAALGNDFQVNTAPHSVTLAGSPTIGVSFFELPQLSAETLARARAFELIVTGSTWNEDILRAHGLANVTTVIQGVDQTLFHPAPKQGVLADRFLVFSGGKLELRKGQDLVVAAFARFARRHPDAVLVSAWHSHWPKNALTLNASGKTAPLALNEDGSIDQAAWIADNGIAPSQFIDLGPVPNALMPSILREMDVALFPNRCEGGTNLVAMECMACGVPTILSANTGHLDLIDDRNCYALEKQTAVAGAGSGVGAVPGWGDSSIEEIEDALERAYTDRNDAQDRAKRAAAKLSGLTWSRTAAAMKRIVEAYN